MKKESKTLKANNTNLPKDRFWKSLVLTYVCNYTAGI